MGPIIQFLLEAGVGFREFAQIAKNEFVTLASRTYGVRGRPTNISRVAVMTGLTRKEVKSIREADGYIGSANDNDMERVNPATVLLHAWHSDPSFLDDNRVPKKLAPTGDGPTFSELCKRYAGDIPSGAMLSELRRAGSIKESADGSLIPTSRYYTPSVFDSRFVGSMAFSLGNLARTLFTNARYSRSKDPEDLMKFGLMERYVWTSRLSEQDSEEFKKIAEQKTERLLAELDEWIGSREIPPHDLVGKKEKTATKELVGLGLYLFEKDSRDPNGRPSIKAID